MIKKIKNLFKQEEKQSLEVNLIRQLLGGITLDFVGGGGIEDNLKEEERRKLYADAKLLFHNKAFKQIADHLINVQGNFSVKESLDMGQNSFGRATINGICLFREEAERLASMHKDKSEIEKFDKHELI